MLEIPPPPFQFTDTHHIFKYPFTGIFINSAYLKLDFYHKFANHTWFIPINIIF